MASLSDILREAGLADDGEFAGDEIERRLKNRPQAIQDKIRAAQDRFTEANGGVKPGSTLSPGARDLMGNLAIAYTDMLVQFTYTVLNSVPKELSREMKAQIVELLIGKIMPIGNLSYAYKLLGREKTAHSYKTTLEQFLEDDKVVAFAQEVEAIDREEHGGKSHLDQMLDQLEAKQR